MVRFASRETYHRDEWVLTRDSFVVWIPFNAGRWMSMMTTAGCRVATSESASSPLCASPTVRRLAVRRQQITKKPTYRYEQLLKRHIIPSLGAIPLRHVHKGVIKDFLTEKLSQEVKIQNPFLKPTNQREKRLARNSVRNLHAILRAMLRAATDDGLIVVNPAEKLGRQLRLVT